MAKLLWEPSEERIKNSNIYKFMQFVNEKYGTDIKGYRPLYKWSVENIPEFWASFWDYADIKYSKSYDTVIDDLGKMPGAKWFEGARLNFSENLLRYRDDHVAFIFRGETQKSARMTYAELYDTVARLARSLREMGVAPGDRVAAYMPNMMETAVAMLAATSIGATWASCATDIGSGAVLDRFGQIEPKVLFTVNGYFYKAKPFDTLINASEIAKGMPSVEKVIVASYTEDRPDISNIPNSAYFEDFLSKESGLEIQFEQLPFDHPLFIMFSSGTTGKPKCLVQGAGGILLNQVKELILQSDLKREDVQFFITTCSWMMWNWMLTSLATGNTLILYDGNPNYPDTGAVWKLIQDEKVSMFGTSASYINFIKSQGLKPGKDYDLSSLKEIWQTGSPLSPEGFEYVYQEIKKDLWFNSSAGGTDINGCFFTGSPTSPVYAGELQSPGLAMKINVYDEKGDPILDQEGELVCEAPAPSMPLYFWNDPDNKRYHDAYFDVYPNVWRHGDYIVINSETGGATFCGRSDAVLKPSGVRIGTAEIYNQVEKLEEIADSLAIGQNWKGDQRIILFVKLAEGYELTDDLKGKIKKTLRANASPRHVPAKIIETPDIPYTFNMKKVESAVTNILQGKAVLNRDALGNPESLDFYENIKELQED
ncbi:MAG: acetoacetate--CoA ligase [Deltaproteobacteria bacterium]|nr:acetoacetate--CoA ligase [Deltaproteobacteria bacterium]MBW2118071.1 acetoacetate--CoA ligase [Deltaproteobacteria bacterium]MBW2343437.1 acetoacetate--CoA ligase [Deltaproteobacteria bacterium]